MNIARYTMIAAIVFLLGSCASVQEHPQLAGNPLKKEKVIATTGTKYPSKNPRQVVFYLEKNSPERPYRIIGVGIVSQHNLIGMQRAELTMHSIMCHLAASIGGDAIMNISKDNKAMEAKIIAYEKVLI